MSMFNCPPRPDLEAALRKAASDFAALPHEAQAEVLRAQRRSFVIAEAGFGSDRDEAEYADAVLAMDVIKLKELDRKAKRRMDAARAHLDRLGV